MRVFDQLVLWLGGLGFVAFGAAFLLAPTQTFQLAGITLSGVGAVAEIMAFYGGLELALGALLLICAVRPARHRDGLLLMAATYGAVAGARLIGMVLVGQVSSFLLAALLTESVLSALALIALRTRPRAR